MRRKDRQLSFATEEGDNWTEVGLATSTPHAQLRLPLLAFGENRHHVGEFDSCSKVQGLSNHIVSCRFGFNIYSDKTILFKKNRSFNQFLIYYSYYLYTLPFKKIPPSSSSLVSGTFNF